MARECCFIVLCRGVLVQLGKNTWGRVKDTSVLYSYSIISCETCNLLISCNNKVLCPKFYVTIIV